MRQVEPKIYLVGQTQLNTSGMEEFLTDIGSPKWKPDKNVSGGENLIEFMGRMCYRAWQPYDESKPDATNPNVKKVRQGNDIYIKNILQSGHFSVIECCCVSIVLHNISRVFTHEIIRHRLASYSQESGRYVRATDIKIWIPPQVKQNNEAMNLWIQTLEYLENIQIKLAEIFGIDSITDFATKKILTSMFRRLAPMGIATTIGMTANLRSWRHILALRSGPGAEEEMQLVMRPLGELLQRLYPNVFQDMSWSPEGWKITNSEV
jgi:thymidylate synthase (FAD)